MPEALYAHQKPKSGAKNISRFENKILNEGFTFFNRLYPCKFFGYKNNHVIRFLKYALYKCQRKYNILYLKF